MSEDKIKNTIDNLSQRYEKTSWRDILPVAFNQEGFRNLLFKLLEDSSAGIKWQPTFKEVFNPYNSIELSNVEIIIITDDPKIQSTDSLYKQGVLYLAVPMFIGDNPSDYLELSKSTMLNIISNIAYQTTGKIFLFIGKSLEEYSLCIDNKHHRKVFLPELNENSNLQYSYKNLLNNMLEDKIDWK